MSLKKPFEIPVIDLFAGPGGLGEGFNAVSDDELRFSLKLSIEKDKIAHQTLLLRSFFWKFGPGALPNEYYEYLSGKLDRNSLFQRFPNEFRLSQDEAKCIELGTKTHGSVDELIERSISGKPHWVLIGGPPCQAYSIAGRSRNAKVRRNHLEFFESDKRHRLYEEYLRILAKFRPTAFVMENVKGLLSSQLDGKSIFERIRNDLSKPHLLVQKKLQNSKDSAFAGYEIFSLTIKCESSDDLKPEDFVVRAENHGVPQARHRVILFGIQRKYKVRPANLLARSEAPTVEMTIGDLPKLRSRISRGGDNAIAWLEALKQLLPILEKGKREFRKLGRPTLAVLREAKTLIDRPGSFHRGRYVSKAHKKWFFDRRLVGISNHQSRGHMESDLRRYLFCSVWAHTHGDVSSPKLADFPHALLPAHRNINSARNKKADFEDRFRVQVAKKYSSTIVSHIAKDGHYYIHYDPSQCRSLTVREAARLQTFPDNYFFEGNRTEQYAQVGNAVPPLLAKQIAQIVAETLKTICK